MPLEATRRIRFGAFEFDRATGELANAGRRAALQDQPLRILAVLLEHSGQIVTRDELRHAVWAEDVHVDFDRSLNTAVARLRETLGDSPHKPTYIETVPREGYRFIAQIEVGSLLEDEPVPGPDQPLSEPFGAHKQLGRTAALIGACAVGVLAGLLLLDESPPGGPLVAQRLTFFEGIENEAGFSPDGSQVVFTWHGKGQDNFDVYVMTVGGSQPLRLTKHPARDFSPAWSPDGRWIAFLREVGDDQAALYRIPALGGREEHLANVFGAAPSDARSTGVVRFLCWLHDSQSLVLVDREPADEGPSLFVYSPTTGLKRRLTSAPKGASDFGPSISPDGRSLVFARIQGGLPSLYRLQLREDLSAAGRPQRLASRDKKLVDPTWGPGGSEILASTGKYFSQLWRLDVEHPGAMQRLDLVGAEGYLPAFSNSARRLVFTRGVLSADVWRLALAGDGGPPSPRLLISSSGFNSDFQYSPDGREIAFMSDRSDPPGLWLTDSEGAKQARVGTHRGGSPRWSPDGTRIVFNLQFDLGDFDIAIVNARGGPPKRLTQGPADDRVPNWSRDGKWIYFASDRGEGYQVWKRELSSGAEVQVTRKGGFHAIESPDGRYVYYTKSFKDWTVWRAPVDGGKEEQILRPVSSWTNFAITERGIYYSPKPGPDGLSAILFRDFASGAATEVFRPEAPMGAGMDISPDGTSLLFNQIDEGSDLMLVEDFR